MRQKCRVLVVDDEEPLQRAYGRLLTQTGYQVELASSGHEGLEKLAAAKVDVIVSDIAMPGISGLEFLRRVREKDLDIPVILITGYPDIDSAIRAVEYGAMRFLTKPVETIALIETVERASKLSHAARLKRQAAATMGMSALPADRAGLEKVMEQVFDTLWIAYQPLVSTVTGKIYGYEALMRSVLPPPGAFDTAERLGRVLELGRRIRTLIAETLAKNPPEGTVFVNLHPRDLQDDELYSTSSPLYPFSRRVVFEITERAGLEEGLNIQKLVRKLKDLGYRIAIDDLGAGYAGLSYFSLLEPDVVKLDLSLIRNIDQDSVKQKLVGSIQSLCEDLSIMLIAEGIEEKAEHDAITRLGCQILQGYYYARPGPAYPQLTEN